ncbi:Cell cycle protein [Lachnospiraceae bacterium]|nr:Cell cycle protein [Lachnospiraceae bacterium]
MTALAINAVFNICEGFAILPFFSSFLPFISSGGSNLIVSYVFLGMIMSIYKYKNIYPEHIEIKKKQINFKIQI